MRNHRIAALAAAGTVLITLTAASGASAAEPESAARAAPAAPSAPATRAALAAPAAGTAEAAPAAQARPATLAASTGGPADGPLLTGANQGLAYYTPCQLTLTDPTTGKVTDAAPAGAGCSPSATPNGSVIAYFGPDRPTTVPDPAMKQFLHVMHGDGTHSRVVRTDPGGFANVFGPATFTPDGQHLVFFAQTTPTAATQDYTVNLNGTGFTVYNLGIKGVTPQSAPVYSADGSTLAVVTSDGIWLRKGRAAATRLALPGIPATASITSLNLSPNGGRLALADADGDVYVVGTDGQNLREYAASHQNAAGNQIDYNAPVFSPDGKQLAMNELTYQGGPSPADWSTVLVTAELATPGPLDQVSPEFGNGGDSLVWLPARKP